MGDSAFSKFQELDEVIQLVLIGVGIYIIYNLYSAATGPSGLVPDPNDTTGDPNSVGDTSSSAYAGFGVLGTLGNTINKALGGIPQSAGNAIGAALAPSP